jgi:glycosyltransferase involved in cell wall biosynthesis
MSLSNQTYPRHRFELLLINNDPKTSLPPNYSANARIIDQPIPGSYAARNAGIAVATGTIIAFIDSDCIADPNWILNGVLALSDRQDVGCVGGAIELTFKLNPTSLANCHERVFGFRQDLIEKGRPYSVTANMFVRKSVFDDTGLFSQQILSGGDVEWGKRFSKTLWRLAYAENAVVLHPAREYLSTIVSKTVRVSGGQYTLAGTSLKRASIVLMGFIPPIHRIPFILATKPSSKLCQFFAFLALWLTRATRSITFIAISSKLSTPRRT